MKLKVVLPALLVLATAAPAMAVSDASMHPIAPVLASAEYAPKFNFVKFYFGSQPYPEVAQKFGPIRTIRRTHSGEAETACQRAFAAGLINLAETARKLGADAVVNVHTAFAQRDEASPDQYVCATGSMMTGMTVYGDAVKLK
jgi:uncharacterized protein YbjQ (UPF0145 family)